MWTVGRLRSNSAIPRLPRVTRTAWLARARQQFPPGLLEDLDVLADPNPQQVLDFGFVRGAGRHAAKPEERVARVDEHRRTAAGPAGEALARARATAAGVTMPVP